MAKGWTTQVAAAAGVAAATGAAQLGLGYGLGVVVWPVTETADDSVWLGSLGWATWIAASSTVFGAVIASRLQARTGGPWRFALAASAAVGALLPVALIALPARAAVRPDTFSPETIAGGYAVVGVLLGLMIAYWAVVSRPVSANLVATATWLWALAVAAIVVQLTMHRASATYLTSWQFADPGNPSRYGTIYWPSALLTLLAALVIGAIGAWPAVRRGELGIGAAASGAVGPLLVAAAFFVLAPQLTGALGPLESAYLIAPYAVLAGLAGSAATVALGQKAADRSQRRSAAAERRRPRTATGVAAVPPQAPAPEPRRKLALKSGSKSARATEPGAGSSAVGSGSVTKTAAVSPAPAMSSLPTAPAPTGPPPTAPQPVRPRSTTAPRPAATVPGSTGSGAKGTATPRPVASTPGSAAARDVPGASGYRSTVAPPPDSPPIVKINPPRSGESVSARPAGSAAAGPGETAPQPSQKAGAESTTQQSTARPAAAPAKAAAPKATPAKAAPLKAAPAKAAPATPGKATPASKSAPADGSAPAKRTSARATPAKSTPGKAAGQTPAKEVPAAPERVTPSKAAPTTAAPPKAAPPDGEAELSTAPLWVDPTDAVAPQGQETKRRGLRRFGRRPGSDDAGPNPTK